MDSELVNYCILPQFPNANNIDILHNSKKRQKLNTLEPIHT